MCVLSVCAPRGPRKTDVFYIHISLICFPIIYIHTCTSVQIHVHTCTQAHAHVSCDHTGVSSEFFVCSLSRCHTRVFLYVCVRSLLLLHICTHTHTHAAWALCGWRKWRTMMGSLVCLVACRTCVYVCVCLQCSDAFTQR